MATSTSKQGKGNGKAKGNGGKAPTQLATAKANAKAKGKAWAKLSKGQQAAYLAHASPARNQGNAAAKAVATGKANRRKAIAAALIAASGGPALTPKQASAKAAKLVG